MPTKKLLLIIVIALVVLSSLLTTFLSPLMNFGKKVFTPTPPDWYAVSLTNGQVYFGQLKSVTPETITLKKTYFLQTLPDQQQVYNLVRRSTRDTLMPTDDVLFINRAVVLFWEKLTPDSEIVKGILKAEGTK